MSLFIRCSSPHHFDRCLSLPFFLRFSLFPFIPIIRFISFSLEAISLLIKRTLLRLFYSMRQAFQPIFLGYLYLTIITFYACYFPLVWL